MLYLQLIFLATIPISWDRVPNGTDVAEHRPKIHFAEKKGKDLITEASKEVPIEI
jgi:hypothetical protein